MESKKMVFAFQLSGSELETYNRVKSKMQVDVGLTMSHGQVIRILLNEYAATRGIKEKKAS